MAGHDERDPLDSWLSQQVRPLPPPPGTFELITRRARRRKIRKVAVTVGSAAVVAAAVAVAVPGGLLLRINPSPTSVNNVAAGQTPTPSGGTQQQTGTGSPVPTPTHTQSSTPAAGPDEPLGPVPPNFQPSSVTFVNTQHAWVIGQAGTPGHCADANPYFCTSIARTDNAGQTWHGGPAPQTGPPNGASGVSGIRFLDGVNGWAFGPELWVTHDAGNHWHQINTRGQRVTDLETAGDRAFALFASCNTAPGVTQFNFDCTSYTLMTTTADSDNWAPVGTTTNGLTNSGNPTSAVIALTSSTGYLLAPNGALFSGPLDGAWQPVGSARCQPGSGQPNGQPAHAMLALTDSTHLALVCTGDAGVATQAYTSSDGGALWTPAPAPGPRVTSLTSAPNGTLVAATANGLYVLPVGAAQWKGTNAFGTDAPSGGFSYVGMTTNSQGVAVPAHANLHQIWLTSDGGLTWAPATPIAPGSETAASAGSSGAATGASGAATGSGNLVNQSSNPAG